MNQPQTPQGRISPVFLNVRQAAELLGVSERKFHELRAAGLIPAPLRLSERASRWLRDELIQHVVRHAPRGTAAEPARLRHGKARAAGAAQ